MSKQLEKVERERDWMHGRLEECREQVAELRAYAGEATQVLEAMVAEYTDYAIRNHLGNPEKQHNIKWARTVLAKNPNPAGLDPATEASGSQATEASGAGRAGTELTGAQALGDSAGADPAFTGSPAVGTKASSGATNPTVGNCHETNSDLAEALSDLLRQVEAFTEENGEADFFTGRARAALRHQSNSNVTDALPLLAAAVRAVIAQQRGHTVCYYGTWVQVQTDADKGMEVERLWIALEEAGIDVDALVAIPADGCVHQVGGWISVTERLPELHAIVLGTGFNYGDPDRGRWTCVLCRASERHDFGWEATGIGGHEPPTHWMPLPAAPDSCHVAGKKPNDTERLDFLECELGTEKRHPGYVSVFRRNLPVDRIAIDQAMRWVRQREEFAINHHTEEP